MFRFSITDFRLLSLFIQIEIFCISFPLYRFKIDLFPRNLSHFSSVCFYRNNKVGVFIIQGQIDAQLDTLSQEQISGVCHTIGVASMYPLVTNPPSTPLSQHPSCQPLAIQAFMVTLESVLATSSKSRLTLWQQVQSHSYRLYYDTFSFSSRL